VFVDTKILLKTAEVKRSVRTHTLWRRYCYFLLVGAWMGGFTFYALIVIPTAQKVLGGDRDVGFITQQVTRWLNLIGAGVLLIVLGLLAAGWRERPARLRFGLAGTWAIMAVSQVGLFLTHPLIDRFLEAQGHKLHNYDAFDKMHTVYLVIATVQWSAAMLQIWLMLLGWRVQDQER
jgi:hypothetical protein